MKVPGAMITATVAAGGIVIPKKGPLILGNSHVDKSQQRRLPGTRASSLRRAHELKCK